MPVTTVKISWNVWKISWKSILSYSFVHGKLSWNQRHFLQNFQVSGSFLKTGNSDLCTTRKYILSYTTNQQLACFVLLSQNYQHFFFEKLYMHLKDGCAHFTMCILHYQLIDLDLWNVFCEVSCWGNFLFTLQRQNKIMQPWGWCYDVNT